MTGGGSVFEGMRAEVKEAIERAKALIFDCDGTLVDTMGLHLDAWREALSRFGYEMGTVDSEPFIGFTNENFLTGLSASRGWSVDVDAVVADKERAVLGELAHAPAIPHVVALLRSQWKSRSTAVVSNGSRQNVLTSLTAIGVREMFNEVITACDDVPPKPSPEMFLEAARRFAVAPGECVVFEDTPASMDAALRAGMVVVDVRDARMTLVR